MYVNQGVTEYHHLQVRAIDDYSRELNKQYIILFCSGKNLFRTNNAKGYGISDYSIKIFVKGNLMEYCLAELQTRDNIFVIGSTIERKLKYGKQRVLQAECIYKEDWLLYYKSNGNINPIDCIDVFFENESKEL